MTTSQADPAYGTTEERANPTTHSRGNDAEDIGESTAGGATGASLKDQLSFADRHRAPTTKDVETNRWTGAAPGTLKKGAGGLHGGGLVPDGWTPEDGTVGGNTAGTGAGGHSLRREEELGVAGAGVGAGAGEFREGHGGGIGRNEIRREEGYGQDNFTGTGTGVGTTGGALGTTGEMGNTGLTGSSGVAPGADGYEHAHAPGHGLKGAELRRGDFVADQSTHGHTHGDSGVSGVRNEPVTGEHIGEHDNEATGKTKKNPLAKIVDAVKNI